MAVLAAAAAYWAVYCALDLDLGFFVQVRWKRRLLFLPVLLLIAVLVRRWLCAALIRREKTALAVLKNMLPQLVLLSLLWAVLYPGVWFWDELDVARVARHYALAPWQHFLSSLDMMLAGFLAPGLGGVTFVQIVEVSLISGYVLTRLESLTGLACAPRWVRLTARLGFWTLPVILYNFSKYRIILCSYLELLLLVQLLWMHHKGSATLREYLLTAALAVLAGSWRSENIYYILLYPLLLLCLGRKDLPQKLAVSLLAALAVVAIGNKNTSLIGNDNYTIMSTLDPAVALIRTAAEEPEQNRAELETMDKLVDVALITGTTASGDSLYWQGGLVREYTEQQYREYLHALVTLILRYPRTFWAERWAMFVNSAGCNSRQVNIVATTAQLFDGTENRHQQLYAQTSDEQPLNIPLRRQVIYFLGCRDSSGQLTPAFYLVWNLVLPLALMVLLILAGARAWPYVSMCLTACLLKVPIIFLTAPGNWFMYYFSIYLIGYVAAFFALAMLLQSRRQKLERADPQ